MREELVMPQSLMLVLGLLCVHPREDLLTVLVSRATFAITDGHPILQPGMDPHKSCVRMG